MEQTQNKTGLKDIKANIVVIAIAVVCLILIVVVKNIVA